jgi:hypothetical protein
LEVGQKESFVEVPLLVFHIYTPSVLWFVIYFHFDVLGCVEWRFEKNSIMEDGAFKPNTAMLGSLFDNTMDFSLMDELLLDGFWLETTDGSNFW